MWTLFCVVAGSWLNGSAFGVGPSDSDSDSDLASAPESLERPPVYWSVGASSIVPFDELGAWTTIDGVIAAQINPAARLGLRFSRALDDVNSMKASDTGRAWAAILELRKRWDLSTRVHPQVIVAGGFVAGEREDGDLSNVVMPIVQLGLGFHLRLLALNERSQFFLEPELGIIPGVIYDREPLSIAAPYSGIRLGLWVP